MLKPFRHMGMRGLVALGLNRTLKLHAALSLRRELRVLRNEKDIFFMILMPGAAHIGIAAASVLARRGIHTKLIVNGLSRQEREFVARQTGSEAAISLPIRVRHDVVIDALISSLNNAFWLIDHDCFVFDAKLLFGDLNNRCNGSAGISYFYFTNCFDGCRLPHTFLLCLNPVPLRLIRQRFNVKSRVYFWDNLPPRAKKCLLQCGIAEGTYPQEGLPYFDTMRLLAVLASLSGCGFRFAELPDPDSVFHGGNCARPEWRLSEDNYHALGALFWLACLEQYPDLRDDPAYVAREQTLPELGEMEDMLAARGQRFAVKRIKESIENIFSETYR